MSRKDDKTDYELALLHHSLKDIIEDYNCRNFPELYRDLAQLPPFEEIDFEEYRKLNKRKRKDYYNRTGYFDRDPQKRAEAREFYARHTVWDYARHVALGLFLGIVLNDVEPLIGPVMIIVVAVFIIAHIRVGEWWL